MRAKETQNCGAGNDQASLAQHVNCTVNLGALDPDHPGSGDRKEEWEGTGKFGSKQVGIRHIELCSFRDESITLELSQHGHPWPGV